MSKKKLLEIADDYIEAKMFASAEKILLKALKNEVDTLRINEKLAYVYLNMNNFEAGFSLLKKVCNSQQSSPEANFYLGKIYFEKSKFLESKKYIERSLCLSPIGDFYEGLFYLGLTLVSLDENRDAIKVFTRALEINPKCAKTFYHIGICLEKLGDYEKSLIALNLAYDLEPNLDFLIGKIIKIKLSIGDWTNLNEYKKQLVENINKNIKATTPLYLVSILDDPLKHLNIAKLWAENEFHFNNDASPFPPRTLTIGKKVRIGYFSADFRIHPVAFLIAGLIENHDRNNFEIIGFSLKEDCSEIRSRLKKSFDTFVDCENASDDEIIQISREMQLDIAVDLGGYTEHARSRVFFSRVAPIQINYLGYPGSLGSKAYDFILADKNIIPLTHAKFYTEKIIYLECYQVNDDKRHLPDLSEIKSVHNLPEDKIIYCCFSNNFKITPEIFESWCNILISVEDSVLWILEDNTLFKKNIIDNAFKRGVQKDRIIFAPRVGHKEHLNRLRLADICLDTYPYNGHTTSSDLLWCNVPIITIKGDSFASRVTASLLSCLNLDKLVTHSNIDYEELAISYGNKEEIWNLKEELRVNKIKSNLFNTKIFAEKLEEVYLRLISELAFPRTVDTFHNAI